LRHNGDERQHAGQNVLWQNRCNRSRQWRRGCGIGRQSIWRADQLDEESNDALVVSFNDRDSLANRLDSHSRRARLFLESAHARRLLAGALSHGRARSVERQRAIYDKPVYESGHMGKGIPEVKAAGAGAAIVFFKKSPTPKERLKTDGMETLDERNARRGTK